MKEENDGQIFRNGSKVQPNMDEDHMYMKVNMDQLYLTCISFLFPVAKCMCSANQLLDPVAN